MRGFSLVELSIVLVILGLLTGGILSGQSLIRAAEMRSVVSDFQRYQSAYYSFRDRYKAIPGDMTNATRFWGIAGGTDGTGAACFTVDSSTLPDPKATCNGSGDGLIVTPTGGSSQVWQWGERYRFWQHLANAGLIEGSYSGRTDSTSNRYLAAIGKNVPAGRIGSSYYYPYGRDSFAVATDYFNTSGSGNVLQILELSSSNGNFASPLLPEETWNLDTKLDDGRPAYGKIRSARRSSSYAPNCTSSDDNDAVYDVQSKAKCYVFMFID